jgi:hypothetical protein
MQTAVLLALILPGMPGIGIRAEEPMFALAVEHGRAMVREVREITLESGRQQILLKGLPSEADLSTLSVRGIRFPISVHDVRRMDAPLVGSLTVEGRGPARAVTWHPQHPAKVSERSEGLQVWVELTSRRSGQQPVELVYGLEGLDWRVHYQAVVRGDLQRKASHVALELQGHMALINRTSGSWEQAAVRLVGSERANAEQASVAADPGFLMLDPQSPLAALWLAEDEEPGEEPSFTYPLKGRINIPAYSESEVSYVQADRIRLERRYLIDSADVPLNNPTGPQAVSAYITFRNTQENGLGKPLPPGQAVVFRGGLRGHMGAGAYLPRTAIGEEMRIAMGQDPRVTVRRNRLFRKRLTDGTLEGTYEIILDNQRADPVQVEMFERPAAARWNIVSAGEDYTEHQGALRFEFRVGANQRRRIQYRITEEQPGI